MVVQFLHQCVDHASLRHGDTGHIGDFQHASNDRINLHLPAGFEILQHRRFVFAHSLCTGNALQPVRSISAKFSDNDFVAFNMTNHAVIINLRSRIHDCSNNVLCGNSGRDRPIGIKRVDVPTLQITAGFLEIPPGYSILQG